MVSLSIGRHCNGGSFSSSTEALGASSALIETPIKKQLEESLLPPETVWVSHPVIARIRESTFTIPL
jgi:hypothetical protein